MEQTVGWVEVFGRFQEYASQYPSLMSLVAFIVLGLLGVFASRSESGNGKYTIPAVLVTGVLALAYFKVDLGAWASFLSEINPLRLWPAYLLATLLAVVYSIVATKDYRAGMWPVIALAVSLPAGMTAGGYSWVLIVLAVLAGFVIVAWKFLSGSLIVANGHGVRARIVKEHDIPENALTALAQVVPQIIEARSKREIRRIMWSNPSAMADWANGASGEDIPPKQQKLLTAVTREAVNEGVLSNDGSRWFVPSMEGSGWQARNV